MRNRNVTTKSIIFICLLGAGCQAGAPSQQPILSATMTEGSSEIVPSATGTHTSTPEPAPTPALPPKVLEDVLFSGESLDCHLPCWYGLRVGVSSEQDIQHVFDTAFGFNGTIDLFDLEPEIYQSSVADVPGTFTTGYDWVDEEENGVLSIHTVTNEAGKLLGIEFLEFAVLHELSSPAEVVRYLGTPDRVLVTVEGKSDDDILLRFVLMYSNGMAFTYTIFYPRDESAQFHYCLNQAPGHLHYYIVEPFEDFTPQTAKPLQQEWIFDYLARFPFTRINESVLGITEDEFAAKALSDSPCFDIPKP